MVEGGDDDEPGTVVTRPDNKLPLVVTTFSHSVQEPVSPEAISICPPESQTVSQLPTARVRPTFAEHGRSPNGDNTPTVGKGLEREDFLADESDGDSCQPIVLWPWIHLELTWNR